VYFSLHDLSIILRDINGKSHESRFNTKENKMKKDGKFLRVIVVDDEPLIRMFFSRFLGKKALVKTASTAEEALVDIGEQPYDLCFLDVNLPGMNGLDAMKIINEQFPNTKVAIMTASFLDETLKKQVEDFAYAFIPKPFGISDIEGVVEKVQVAMN
jgi:DNA-binding NtrC family response regulator